MKRCDAIFFAVETPAISVGRARVTSRVNRKFQLMNASVIQSIGSLSRQLKAKVLGLQLVDVTSSPKMLQRKSLLQQAAPFSSDSEF